MKPMNPRIWRCQPKMLDGRSDFGILSAHVLEAKQYFFRSRGVVSTHHGEMRFGHKNINSISPFFEDPQLRCWLGFKSVGLWLGASFGTLGRLHVGCRLLVRIHWAKTSPLDRFRSKKSLNAHAQHILQLLIAGWICCFGTWLIGKVGIPLPS